MLIEHYQVYFVAEEEATTKSWLEEYIGVPAWRHLIVTHRRDLLYGDYLVARKEEGETRNKEGGERSENMLATVIEYGSDTFKTWEDIMDYFSKLGGQ